jgi:hypothetical protein
MDSQPQAPEMGNLPTAGVAPLTARSVDNHKQRMGKLIFKLYNHGSGFARAWFLPVSLLTHFTMLVES